MPDDINAFVPGPRVHIEGRDGGPLTGLTFAAKDLFDVAGFPTGGGNPDWARSNPVPTRHAWAVQRLLDAGATLIGKTITDEVSLIIAVDAFAFAEPEVAEALQPMVGRLSALIGDVREEVMAPGGIVQWARAQRTLQPSEAWLTFKDWIDRDNPRFAFSVARNMIF